MLVAIFIYRILSKTISQFVWVKLILYNKFIRIYLYNNYSKLFKVINLFINPFTVNILKTLNFFYSIMISKYFETPINAIKINLLYLCKFIIKLKFYIPFIEQLYWLFNLLSSFIVIPYINKLKKIISVFILTKKTHNYLILLKHKKTKKLLILKKKELLSDSMYNHVNIIFMSITCFIFKQELYSLLLPVFLIVIIDIYTFILYNKNLRISKPKTYMLSVIIIDIIINITYLIILCKFLDVLMNIVFSILKMFPWNNNFNNYGNIQGSAGGPSQPGGPNNPGPSNTGFYTHSTNRKRDNQQYEDYPHLNVKGIPDSEANAVRNTQEIIDDRRTEIQEKRWEFFNNNTPLEQQTEFWDDKSASIRGLLTRRDNVILRKVALMEEKLNNPNINLSDQERLSLTNKITLMREGLSSNLRRDLGMSQND